MYAQVTSHTRIHFSSLLQVIDDPHEDRLYLVMQYLEGGPVMQDGDAALGPRDAAVAVADVAAALSYLHWQGVCHGDVKPDNMLRGADGRVRLTDFSVSQARNVAGLERKLYIAARLVFGAF